MAKLKVFFFLLEVAMTIVRFFKKYVSLKIMFHNLAAVPQNMYYITLLIRTGIQYNYRILVYSNLLQEGDFKLD